MFATGIENSIPTINNGKTRVDQMEVVRPLRALARGFRLRPGDRHQLPALRAADPPDLSRPGQVRLGIRRHHLRRSEAARHHADRRSLPFRRAGLDRQFPEPGFPAAVRALCRRRSPSAIPWVQLYTPVNEMFICAVFSAKYGWWNEQLKTDQGFVTALKHIVKANVLAMLEILKRRADAIFIQSRILGIFPCRQPGRDSPGGAAELAALPQPRPQLRPAGRQRDVRIS